MNRNPVQAQLCLNDKPQVAMSAEPFHDESSFNPTRGEQALWSAVITQALMDAGSKSRKPELVQEKAKAIRWLLGDSEDFHIVCQNAGLDPRYVREKAEKAIERGCVWRKGMTAETLPAFKKSISSVVQYASPALSLPATGNVLPADWRVGA